MDDLEAQMNSWLKQVENLNPTTQQKAAMTKAGAVVYEKELKSKTPKSARMLKKTVHLQDAIASQNTDIDGTFNGSSVVGFGKKAHIARFMNDGTKKYPRHPENDHRHFLDNAQRNSEPEVFEAQRQVYEHLMGGGR